MSSFNVNSLSNYVAENKDILIKDIVLGGEGGDTIPYLTKQLGVKTSERLHPTEIVAQLQAVDGCGFSATAGTTFSERLLSTTQIKVNQEYCKEDLLGKFAEYAVTISAADDSLPFEAQIMDGVVRSINKNLEKLVWTGDKSEGDLIDGFVTIAEGADSAKTITGTVSAGGTAYEAIKNVLAKIPEAIQDEAVIFVSPAYFREYTQDLVAANLYHYNPADGDFSDMFIPGSNVKVHKTYGLTGSNKIYASSYKNLVYGCDLVNAKEEIKAWFSDDNDTERLKVRFNAGVQTVFPDMVVLVTRQ